VNLIIGLITTDLLEPRPNRGYDSARRAVEATVDLPTYAHGDQPGPDRGLKCGDDHRYSGGSDIDPA
jgi:hypothetical protein